MYFDSVADALAMGGMGFCLGRLRHKLRDYFLCVAASCNVHTYAECRHSTGSAEKTKCTGCTTERELIVHPKRKQRLIVALVIVVLSSVTIGLITLCATRQYQPVLLSVRSCRGKAPIDRQIRVGGMV